MIVLIVVSILAMVAVPVFQNELRNSDVVAVEQELKNFAEQLERYKSRNFSYHGFDPKYLYDGTNVMSSINFLRKGSKKYTIMLYDSVRQRQKLLNTDNRLG